MKQYVSIFFSLLEMNETCCSTKQSQEGALYGSIYNCNKISTYWVGSRFEPSQIEVFHPFIHVSELFLQEFILS